MTTDASEPIEKAKLIIQFCERVGNTGFEIVCSVSELEKLEPKEAEDQLPAEIGIIQKSVEEAAKALKALVLADISPSEVSTHVRAFHSIREAAMDIKQALPPWSRYDLATVMSKLSELRGCNGDPSEQLPWQLVLEDSPEKPEGLTHYISLRNAAFVLGKDNLERQKIHNSIRDTGEKDVLAIDGKSKGGRPPKLFEVKQLSAYITTRIPNSPSLESLRRHGPLEPLLSRAAEQSIPE